jgi:omega-6 fatty acid desaturase (delta-12 desaturase)
LGHRKPTPERVAHYNQVLAPYRGADDRRSAVQLAVSAAAFVGCWLAMLWSLDVHPALTAALAFPTAGFLMRLFMIQHDCGHGSFFTSRRARDWTGFCIGILTLTPYQYWRKTHAYHHAHSGDLDFRGFGDIDTLTVAEYRALAPMKRLGYRVYRNPLLLLTVGPLFHFVIKHRFPWDIPRDWRQAWRSVWWTNVGLAVIVITLGTTLGWGRFLAVQLPVTWITCSLGVLLFYVQHQFEETYWHRHDEWDYFDAALEGSSHLALPRPLQWITASIGIHHIHHLNARIPNYRLEEVMNDHPEFQKATRITMVDAWRLLGLALWDEERRELVSFRSLRTA